MSSKFIESCHTKKTPVRVELTSNCFAGSCRTIWLQRHSVSSPGIEPGPRPSQGRMRNPAHSEDKFQIGLEPRRGIEPRPTVSNTAVHPAHSQGIFVKKASRPGVEPGPELSESQCIPLHHRDITRADDWIRTSINRFTKPALFSIEPRRRG